MSNCWFVWKSHITFLILSECKPGFLGQDCLQTCGENYYGNLCKNKCDCNETQICHHVCGCLRISSKTNDSSIAKNVTSSYFSEACSISTKGINYCLIFSFLTLIDLRRYFCHVFIYLFFWQLLTVHSMLHNQKKVCACYIHLPYSYF